MFNIILMIRREKLNSVLILHCHYNLKAQKVIMKQGSSWRNRYLITDKNNTLMNPAMKSSVFVRMEQDTLWNTDLDFLFSKNIKAYIINYAALTF